MLKFVNLISGSGSTNLSVLQAESNGGKLNGKTETIAIISSSSDANGIQKAIDFGFTREDILTVDLDKRDLASQLLKILDQYQQDYFHQLGWMPWTPPEVLRHYQGLNQHLGPGGRWMYGERRVYAHMRFCEETGRQIPLPIFCQYVGHDYDVGEVIYIQFEDLLPEESPKQVADRMLPIEHAVQIEGRRLLASGSFERRPVPQYARDEKEEILLEQLMKEARDKYPR